MDEPEIIDAADLPLDLVEAAMQRAVGREVPLKLDGEVIGAGTVAKRDEGYVFEGVVGRMVPITDGDRRKVGDAFMAPREDGGFTLRYTLPPSAPHSL